MSASKVKSSMRNYLLFGFAALFIVLGGVGAWASLTAIQGAVIATGLIVVETTSKRVQHREGGIVSKIHVRNGSYVKVGQTLIELDETEIRAELGIIDAIRIDWLAKVNRLQAERDNADEITFDSELLDNTSDKVTSDLIEGQKRLFEAQRTALAGRKEQLQARIQQLGQEIKGLQAQLAANEKQTDLIREELEGAKDLLEKGLVQRPRVLALEREAARLEGQSGQFVAEIARTEGRISETKLQLIQLEDDTRTNALTQLREAEAKLQEFSERRIAVAARLGRTTITAPRNGMVHELNVHTIGGVIAPGETVMLIVPAEDKLIIEAQVRPQDIDQVAVGQSALLRFPNADAQLTPQIDGEVAQVSADLRQPDANSPPYYVVRLQLKPGEQSKLGSLELKPGMPVEAFVKTKQRSPLAYLVQPLSDQLARAFREGK